MTAEIQIGEMCFPLRDEIAWLVAADAMQERNGPGDEIRAELMRDLAGFAWPKNVDTEHRFDGALLRHVADILDRVAYRWMPNQSVRVKVGELSPGVVGIVGVGATKALKALVCTRDVGPTLSAHLSTRFAQIVRMMGNRTMFDTHANEVQADLDRLSECTQK